MSLNVNFDFGHNNYKKLFKPYIRKIFYGGRGGGKSESFARALIIKSLEKKIKILCTREIQKSIQDSVYSLLKKIIYEHGLEAYFRITNDSIQSIRGSIFIFKGLRTHLINNIKSLDDIDICWIEEAQTVSIQSLDILDPTIRKDGSEIWFSFNRYHEYDPVWIKYCISPRKTTLLEKINIFDLDKKFQSKKLLEDAAYDKEKDYQKYLHIWDGQVSKDLINNLINIDHLKKAINRNISSEGRFVVGIDVAREGDDRTVFYLRKGLKTIKVHIVDKGEKKTKEELNKWDINKFLGDEFELFMYEYRQYKSIIMINIDDTGVGGGFGDELIRRGWNINRIKFGDNAEDNDKYGNLISEMWWNFQNILNEISIPEMPDLIVELSSRKKGLDSKSRLLIQSKKDFKKDYYRSPDLADGCILCYHNACKIIPNYNEVLDDIDKYSNMESTQL